MPSETPVKGAFAIFVTIDLHPGRKAEFMPLILANASAARRDEPGNLGFVVLEDESDENRLHFFEQYRNAAALDDHRNTPHYKAYATGTEGMIANKQIVRCQIAG
ncbi:MAG: putative quinol monooxygenase [Rhodospirillales bacterium]